MSNSIILKFLVAPSSRLFLRNLTVQTTWWKIPVRQFASEGKRGKRKFVEAAVVKSTKSTKQTVDVWKRMLPSELASALSVDLSEITEILENLDRRNVDAIIGDLPLDDVSILQTTAAFSFKPRFVNGPPKKVEQEDADLRPQSEASSKDLERRPPIVTIMGHVDHGKTTLLDALRNSQIAAGEFGGITQHIGAFSVELTKGRRVTFLDTPGHAAFASMRARGAKGADIVVLVVAADDGVKEQTAQSIKFAKDANVQLVVAVNKIDKPNADPMRAMRSLLEHDVVVEQLGGDIQCVEVSALQSRNLPALQDALLLQADLMDLKATKKGNVEAVIIESSVVHGIGKVCTLVVSRGTLKKGFQTTWWKIPVRQFASEGKRGKRKFVEAAVVKSTKSTKQTADVWKRMLPSELASALSVDLSEITEILENIDRRNVDAIIGDLPLDDVSILQTTAAFSFKPRFVNGPPKKVEQEDADLRPQGEASSKDLERRPPIVTIMGHVDHGKTTLLDALRNSQIAAGEFGGITQHIGAFSVELTKGRRVTFLDTPGHAAFASMRARGAKGADIVVLVVAADDGVKEQTAQSIKFAKDANVQLVVAVNKIDKPNADPMRAMRSLLEHDVVVEQLGGDIQCVEVSALQSRNLPALQDALLLQADLMDLKATKKGNVEAVIIESSVIHGIGKVCTLVVSRGTLKKGCVLVAGNSWCRVKTMHDENGKIVLVASPSQPVRVSGWKDELPTPGDLVLEAETVDRAQKAVNLRIEKTMREKADRDWEETKDQRDKARETYLSNRQQLLDRGQRFGSTLRSIVHRNQRMEKDVEDGSPKFRLIVILIRTDVEGTLEAILEILNTYNSEQCKLQLVDFEVGPPTEKDIELAKETGATLYTFNVETTTKIKQRADAAGVQIDSFNVIYRMVEALKGELSARLPKRTELHLVGEGHVLKEFMISDRGRKRQPIAGTLVNWGNFDRHCVYKFTRGNQVIFEGEIETMKAGMEVVTNAKTNTEVGLALSDKNIRFKEDDQVEAYEKRTITEEIDWYPPGF
ncbi:hypothetical protein CAEBREN_24211 [Caenorhabditis brenneri]|uniref:Tr-type G domain-containing protein n=1 Tax=Caenorhabditis brenneri TaxID=135651 RepID=G0NPL6_CAEBE|nr:hypothetical protein CAEBREN_24211 [Caenorhabditis brenneri]